MTDKRSGERPLEVPSDPEKRKKFENLHESFQASKVNRRGFITGALALGVSLPAAMSLVERVEAATPKKGGRLRQAVTGGAL